MTTAHRPTWKPAYGLSDSVGRGFIPTRSYSARDLPGYLKLKERQWGQGSVDQLKEKDFKAELIKRQQEARRKKNGDLTIIEEDLNGKRLRDEQVDFITGMEPAAHKRVKKPGEEEQEEQNEENPFPEDEDSQQFVKQDERQKKKKNQKKDSDDEDEDDEDDEQLLKQYEKIKQQRERQQLWKREEKHKESIKNREAELLKGNPLIDSSYAISKRWYEDTVFRNQAKKVEEKKSFINDYVRSDFHRKFMNRFVMR